MDSSDRETRRLFLKQMATTAALASMGALSATSASSGVVDDVPPPPSSTTPASPDAASYAIGDAPALAPEATPTSDLADPEAPSLLNPNILVIKVDQFRWPLWLDQAHYTTYLSSVIPNIGGLMSQSFVFPQFYCNATPAPLPDPVSLRASILTNSICSSTPTITATR